MTLNEWVTEQVHLQVFPNRRSALVHLMKRTGVSLGTLEPVCRGARMGNYPKARAVSEATDWAVTVIDLCDPDPETMLKVLNVES